MSKQEYIQANKQWLADKAKEEGVKALGKFSQPGIPGGSTLIFEIELLGIA